MHVSLLLSCSDESELLDKMPLVMRIAIAMDINLTTFQKIALFQVPQPALCPKLKARACFKEMRNDIKLKMNAKW